MRPPSSVATRWADGAARLARAGVKDARFAAEVLLRHATGYDRARLLRELPSALPPAVDQRYDVLLARAAAREPVAYITGHREFYGLDLVVDRRVLIPRPETETLVELTLAACRAAADAGVACPVVVDVGTGSGAVALAVAAHARLARIIALDRSADALAVALANCGHLRLTKRVTLVQTDLLAGLGRCPDVVAANLPYIPEDDLAVLEPEIRDWEPRTALAGGPDGLDLYRRLVGQWCGLWARSATLPAVRRPTVLLGEIGADQAEAMASVVREYAPDAAVSVHADLAGDPRVVRAVLGGPRPSDDSVAPKRRRSGGESTRGYPADGVPPG